MLIAGNIAFFNLLCQMTQQMHILHERLQQKLLAADDDIVYQTSLANLDRNRQEALALDL